MKAMECSIKKYIAALVGETAALSTGTAALSKDSPALSL